MKFRVRTNVLGTRVKSLAFSTLVLLSGPVAAANLIEVYREAQKQDAAYASARAAFEAGQEKTPQGLSLLLPSINLSANTTRNDVDSPTTNRQYNSNGYSLVLNQPIYHKQNFAQYEQAKNQTSQAESQFSLARQDLIVRVTQAYFDVLLAQDNVVLAGAQKAAIGEQLEQAKRNFEVGTVTITDTHEAQARFDLTTAQEIAAQNEMEIKNRALQLILGAAPVSLDTLNDAFPLTLPEPNDMAKWVAQAEQQSPLIAIQRAALEIANQEIEKNRAGHYPTLDLVAGYSQNNNASYLISGTVNTQTIGLQLNVPIFQGGSTNSKVREAVAGKEKARQDLELSSRQAALQTRQAFLGVTSGLAQVKALNQALISSQSSLDSTRLGQEVGVRTNVDVLNAQQQFFTAKRDLSQARYNYIISQLKLKSSVGILRDEDVEQVSLWLGTKSEVVNDLQQPVAQALPSINVPDELLGKAINSWVEAWKSGNAQAYLDFYTPNFVPADGVSHKVWSANRKKIISRSKNVSIELAEIKVVMQDQQHATTEFKQTYHSKSYSDTVNKKLEWGRESDRWLILSERTIK